MEIKLNMGFEQVFSLANQLPVLEKEKLISALQKSLNVTKNKGEERQFGKFKGKIWMADDFNEPLDDFKEYMK
ncbi:hypothetical protein BH23BAC1_BH23BAC1_50790 [soil metagenome]